MAIKMVREPSEAPNIKNTDDMIGLRYAYGNQNGYVIGKGNEISHSINGSTFTINSGRIVLQGVESDIDANGVPIPVDNVAEMRYFSVYYKVNLATNTTSIESTYDTVSFPSISSGDDLTKILNGSASLVLYRFTAQNGTIQDVEKIVKPISYVNGDYIKNTKVNNAINSDNATNSTNATYAIYSNTDTSKGTIANRLDSIETTKLKRYIVTKTAKELHSFLLPLVKNNTYPISISFFMPTVSTLSWQSYVFTTSIDGSKISHSSTNASDGNPIYKDVLLVFNGPYFADNTMPSINDYGEIGFVCHYNRGSGYAEARLTLQCYNNGLSMVYNKTESNPGAASLQTWKCSFADEMVCTVVYLDV